MGPKLARGRGDNRWLLAAHLPGLWSAVAIPVIGVPIASGPLNGVDFVSIADDPRVPVACMAIDGAYNGALLAVEIWP